MSSLGEAVAALESELKTLADDTSHIARLRRIAINDALADAFYGLRDILKREGNSQEADEAHSRANKYWGRVMAETSDLDG